MLLVCPDCATVNRVPDERLKETPVCGRCAAPLADGKPRALDASGFGRMMNRHELPTVVDFWAPWCGPCRTMAPQFESAAAQLRQEYTFAKVDTEAQPALAAQHNIRSIPTVAVFAGGRELARVSGALPAPELIRWLRSVALPAA